MAKHPRSRLTYQPGTDEGPVATALAFVRMQLPAWRDDPYRPRDSSEKSLNSSLCDFLETRRARENCPMVRFKHEAPAEGRPKR